MATFDSALLLDALTLGERLSAFRLCPQDVPEAFEPELARRRLAAWRSQAPFHREELLARRLAADGLDETTFHRLAGEKPQAIARRLRERPPWLDILEAAFARAVAPSLPPLPEALGIPAHLVRFLPLAAPVAGRGLDRLREHLHQLERTRAPLPFESARMEELLYPLLARRLAIMLSRTLILELHVASHRGLLRGETSEARFECFVKRLGDRRAAMEILCEYPVLARQIVVAVENWTTFCRDLLTHLAEDWQAIGELLAGGADPGQVVALQGGMGDSHRGGRSVVALRTTTGLGLVYKPRSMAADVAFQRLLVWLGERGAEPGFRPVRVLDRGTHGFMEHVAPAACDSVAQVRRFYRRQGGYLALLYLLDATDFHHENLIAAGEHPVLIDLEALFHPSHNAPDVPATAHLRSGELLLRSVLRVGLLPQRTWADEHDAGVDISGLAARGGQQVRDGLLDVDEAGTDRMRFVRRLLNLPGSANRPTLHGEDVDLTAYRDEVVEGFTTLYRLLLAHRDELLAAGGPLADFAHAEVRVLVRPTQAYHMLLSEGFHPDLLRSAVERERFLDRLWVGVQERPYLARLLAHERHALERIDVPAFTTRPCSRDLWTDSGVRLPDFLGETGLERVRRQLARWGEEDLRRQAWLVQTTLASVELFAKEAPDSGYTVLEGETAASRKALVAAARRCAGRLRERAFHLDEQAWWFDFQPLGNDYWTLQPFGPDLYSGAPGIAVFLAYLGALTGDTSADDLGRAAFRAWQRMLEQPSEMSAGVFSGWAGGLYALAHLAAIWKDIPVGELSGQLLDRLPAAIEADRNLDVIGGVAGCALGLLAFHRATGSVRALELAVRCGERLLQASCPTESGRGWITPLAERPLAGFSHGAAGIAWALLLLAAESGEERFRQAAHEGIAHERSLFLPEEGNWPDLRTDRSQGFLAAWCYGAPGIGLARLLGLPHLDDAATRAEIATALQTTLARGMGMNLSLCHGDLGQLDILLLAARTLGDAELERRVYRLAAGVLEVLERPGWPCGTPRGAEPPGLMLGLAGIGYGLLRLAEPERVPSLLALAPPVV